MRILVFIFPTYVMIKNLVYEKHNAKRSGSRGFHEGIFDEGFGGFSTLKKRSQFGKWRPQMGKNGMYGDAFTGQMCISFQG